MERVGALQGRPQRADDGDFEPIEDPGDAQSDDDEQVKPAPRKPIEAERDVGPDHGLRLRHLHCWTTFNSHPAPRIGGKQPDNASAEREFTAYRCRAGMAARAPGQRLGVRGGTLLSAVEAGCALRSSLGPPVTAAAFTSGICPWLRSTTLLPSPEREVHSLPGRCRWLGVPEGSQRSGSPGKA